MSRRLPCYRNLEIAELPPILYFDTSFIIQAIVDGQEYHSESKAFIERLANLPPEEQPYIVFSDFLKTELRCAIISICIKNRFGRDAKVLEQIRVNPDLLKEFYPKAELAEKALSGIMRRFTNWASIPLTEKINENSSLLMKKYRLASYDAIHVATMEDYDIKDIVAFDWGIDELPRYTKYSVWTCGERRRKAVTINWRRRQNRNIPPQSEPTVIIEEAEKILTEQTPTVNSTPNPTQPQK